MIFNSVILERTTNVKYLDYKSNMKLSDEDDIVVTGYFVDGDRWRYPFMEE